MVAIVAWPAGPGNVDRDAISEAEGHQGGGQLSPDNRLLCEPLDKAARDGTVFHDSRRRDPNTPVSPEAAAAVKTRERFARLWRDHERSKRKVYEVAGRSLLLFAALTSGEPVKVIRRLALDLLLGTKDGYEGQHTGEIHLWTPVYKLAQSPSATPPTLPSSLPNQASSGPTV
jgi:hypothetical protein